VRVFSTIMSRRLADSDIVDPIADAGCVAGVLNSVVNAVCHSSTSLKKHDPETEISRQHVQGADLPRAGSSAARKALLVVPLGTYPPLLEVFFRPCSLLVEPIVAALIILGGGVICSVGVIISKKLPSGTVV
jgi:hypothetical protein